MPNTVLPISVYPAALDTDKNLFAVYNTSETVLAVTLNAWQTNITIVPVPLGKPEIWADNGYVTIEGELIYYSDVSLDVNGKVYQLLNCIRRVNGTPAQNYSVGTDVRGFVIAEHHNNLVRALVNIENFVGTLDTTDQETINWKLQYINSLNPLTDDAGCPQIEFYYVITNSSPITGTTIAYNLNIIGNYSGFEISFGDGNTETGTTSGTYSYPPNKQVDPVVTVTSTDCDTLQTSAERVTINDLQGITTPTTNLPVIIPPIPDFPNFDLAVVNPVANNIQFPPIVMPCLDIGPFGPIVVPSTISIINPYPIPSVITFTDVPVFPSVITINNNGAIPSSINIVGTLPSSINVNSNIPSTITVSPSSISLIGPSTISVIGIPSTIQVGDIDINLALNSDYCTVCTNQLSTSAPQTVGGSTDVGCQVCPGANQKISKVTVTIHDFFVQSFTTNQYSRYDLVKLLVVGPDGNNCLLMGGATAGSTATPKFIMNEPVTLTFDDASSNNIYDFNVPLKTQTYAPNANGNTMSRNAGQVTLNTPAPAPGGFNGYGSSLAVFADTDLQSGQWKVYMAVGPASPTFTNLAYLGSACVRVSSTLDDSCPTTPGPTPSGQTMRPTDPPTATPRRTNSPTATPSATQAPTATPKPDPSGQVNPDPGPPIPIIPIPPRPPQPPVPTPPPPTRRPQPSSPPTPTPNCGNCTYVVSLEDCGAGICTYYWNNASSSWSRCAECQNCTQAGGNCSCPEARWMVSFGLLPQDGAGSPAINTNCQEFIWSVEGGLNDCGSGFCAYEYFAPIECQQDAPSCFYYYLAKDQAWYRDRDRGECYSEGCQCVEPIFIEYFFNAFPPNPVDGQIASFNCYKIPKDEEGNDMLDWVLQPGSNCQGATGGCECLAAAVAQYNGLLPKRGTPGGAKEILPCYKKNKGSDNCTPSQCECPPAPTLQAIQSSTQTIKLNCQAICGECWSVWEPDLANPCDPLTTDTTCLYKYSMAGGWVYEEASSSCGCENMRCLTAEEALEYGLLPEIGDTKNLSCYFVGWDQLGGCSPEAEPPCNCPPEPTNPPEGEEPSVLFVVDPCIRATITPTPTSGCGSCYYEFNAPTCGNGGCTYTYKKDIDTWVVLNECTGTGNCDCLPVEFAIFGGLLPSNPSDNEEISLACYDYQSDGLQGNWVYTSNDCTSKCRCESEAPTVPGYYPGEVYAADCVINLNTPTPSPSFDCGHCEWTWDSAGKIWWQIRFCAGAACYCETPSIPGTYEGQTANTGCFLNPTPTPSPSSCGATERPTATPTATPTSTPTQTVTPAPEPGCAGECWYIWNGAGWNLNPTITTCAPVIPGGQCFCQPPPGPPGPPGPPVGTQQLGICSTDKPTSFSNPDLDDLDWGTAEITTNPQKTNFAKQETKATLVPITRERVKFCRHSGRQPLEMVKQNCGACAIRKCEILGLCSHTAVIEGRDDVFCCQLCDHYETEISIDNKPVQVKQPASIEIAQTSLSPRTSIISPLAAVSPISNPVPMIGDAISLADEQIKSNNQIKLVISDSAIKVDINDLLDGNKKKNENK